MGACKKCENCGTISPGIRKDGADKLFQVCNKRLEAASCWSGLFGKCHAKLDLHFSSLNARGFVSSKAQLVVPATLGSTSNKNFPGIVVREDLAAPEGIATVKT